MRTLVYSFLYSASDTISVPDALVQMAQTWVRSLREAACYSGDIMLLTNRQIEITGCHTELIDVPATSSLKRTTDKVLLWDKVPYHDYDSVMFMDLDMVAVADISPMFATDTMRVAPSNHSTLWDFHVGRLLPKIEVKVRSWLRPDIVSSGISSCLFSLSSKEFPLVMSRWQHTILTMSRGLTDADKKYFGDQSYLNCLYFRRKVEVCPYERHEVQHNNHVIGPGTRVLHFPSVVDDQSRISSMERFLAEALASRSS